MEIRGEIGSQDEKAHGSQQPTTHSLELEDQEQEEELTQRAEKNQAKRTSCFYEGFKLDLTVDSFDDVFHVLAIFLLLQFLGLLLHELIEA